MGRVKKILKDMQTQLPPQTNGVPRVSGDLVVPRGTPPSVFGELLVRQDVPQLPAVGDIIPCRVLSVSKNEVHVDIGGITTGVVRGRELLDESGEYSNLRVGDEVLATVLETENESGQMELSFRSAGHQKAWDELTRLFDASAVIDAPIISANRGGLLARIGRVEGFLPVSQLTTEHYPRVEGGDKNRIFEVLSSFVGKSFKVKVIDVNEHLNKLIVSEKAAWEEQQHSLLAAFKPGDVVDGTVTGVVDFGAFIEFGPGLEGLIHISELAWQRVDHPRDYLKVGDKIQAVIIGIEGTKISLSRKRLREDPWKSAVDKYTVGQIVQGKVVKLNPFGAFIELDPDIHGLAHISELSHRIIAHPGDVLKVGERYAFKILSIEADHHRLGLSLKALQEPEEPAAKASESEQPTEDAAASGEVTASSQPASPAPDGDKPVKQADEPAPVDVVSPPPS